MPYLALGDLDQDGTLDATLLRPFLTARLLNIAADPPPEPIVDDLAWSYYTAIRAAEIDGDEVPDLIQCADDNVRVLLAAADKSDPPSSHGLGLAGCILTATPLVGNGRRVLTLAPKFPLQIPYAPTGVSVGSAVGVSEGSAAGAGAGAGMPAAAHL